MAKASGVFLWVDIVVKSLLAGMRLGDRIQDFQRRLDELPPDLENLYEKILLSLDPFYLEQAVQQFALVETAEAPLTILEFSFADEETPESAMRWYIGSITIEQISLRVTAMNRRLNSRTKGFLEIDRGLQSIQRGGARPLSGLTVQYLHRTVRDFIKSPKAQRFLQRSRVPNFDPSLQLCVAYLIRLKEFRQYMQENIYELYDENEQFWAYITKFFRQAARIGALNEVAMIRLLRELKTTVQQSHFEKSVHNFFHEKTGFETEIDRQGRTRTMPRTSGVNMLSFPLRSKKMELFSLSIINETFLILAVMHNVSTYVRAKVQRGGLIRCTESPVVYFPLLIYAFSDDVPEPETVKCLLDIGADPNFKIPRGKSLTPWIVALSNVSRIGKLSDPEESLLAEEKWKQSLRLMLMRGANSSEVPESQLGQKLLRELKDELGITAQSRLRLTRWLRP